MSLTEPQTIYLCSHFKIDPHGDEKLLDQVAIIDPDC
jgi:hypothetical protein